jgi:hypothetical protein
MMEIQATRITEMRGTFMDLATSGETTVKVAEVRRIAREFGFNYMSGRIAAKRANLKIQA